jgi:hypothetical protein
MGRQAWNLLIQLSLQCLSRTTPLERGDPTARDLSLSTKNLAFLIRCRRPDSSGQSPGLRHFGSGGNCKQYLHRLRHADPQTKLSVRIKMHRVGQQPEAICSHHLRVSDGFGLL